MVQSRSVKPSASKASGSLANCAQKWAERTNARMTPDEAMASLTRMLTDYTDSNFGFSDEYRMNLAETLCQFPREVATAACSPIHGIPKALKNKPPHTGQIYEWCEREAVKLHQTAAQNGVTWS